MLKIALVARQRRSEAACIGAVACHVPNGTSSVADLSRLQRTNPPCLSWEYVPWLPRLAEAVYALLYVMLHDFDTPVTMYPQTHAGVLDCHHHP